MQITASGVLGELLHHMAAPPYKVYLDAHFANVVNTMRVNGEILTEMKVNGVRTMVPYMDEKKFFDPNDDADTVNASGYWHPMVDRHCNFSGK